MKRGFEEPSGEPALKKANFRPVGPAVYPPPVQQGLPAPPRPGVPVAAVNQGPTTLPTSTPGYRLTHNPQAAAAAAQGQPYRQLKVEDALNYLDKVRGRPCGARTG